MTTDDVVSLFHDSIPTSSFSRMKIHDPRMPTNPATVDDDDATVNALTMMKQSAQQLDTLLQRVCAANLNANDDDVESDEEVAMDVAVVEALTTDTLVPCAVYFDVLRTHFASPHHISHCFLRTLVQKEEKNERVDETTFQTHTQDVTYMFPVPMELYGEEELMGEEWEMAQALTLDEFQRQITQCLQQTDHTVSAAVGETIATTLACQLVEIGIANCELHVIEAMCPVQCVQSDTIVEWRRGNRVCKMQVIERPRRRQWGLQITLTLETVARAQGRSEEETTPHLGPPLSCTVQCRTFVPKMQYKTIDQDQVTVSTTLSIALVNDAAARTDPEDAVVETVEEPMVHLPEFLNIYHWGGHGTLSTSSSEAIMAIPSRFETCSGFQLLDVPTPFPRNRIVQAACGRLHTLLLNDMGMVFSYGHAMDGALGHGDTLSRSKVFVPQPKLIEFFLEKVISIQHIACGGDDLTGFHSAAVSKDGSLYTWGVGIALGQGSTKSKSVPERVSFPRLTMEGEEAPKLAAISCGSGFCLALGVDGRAFAWGKWSDGRLGLGSIPILTKATRQHGGRRQLQRFQLYPKVLEVTSNGAPVRWRKVSCGDAHCLALSQAGIVFVWGRGRQGQLGLGDVRDAMTPVALSTKTWIDLSAGQDWSMAVDSHGAVWSWGACGAAVLGLSHGDDADRSATVADVLLHKHVQLRQGKHSVTRPPRFHWLRPQPIPSLSHGDAAIRSISAGARHAAAISERGDLYVWGSPDQGLSPQPTLMVSSSTTGRGIGSTIAERVFCGGSQVIALTSGSFLARAMRQLYNSLQVHMDDHGDELSAQEQHPPAGADVVLIVAGGKSLFAHKVVLARRSRLLRDLILNEERPLDSGEPLTATPRVTEVLIPQLRVDIARLLLEFLYTDNLSKPLDPLSYLIRDVLRAAREYEIPLLVHTCRQRIASVSYISLGTILVDFEADDQAQDGDREDALTLHSLNEELAFAFGDATWADLRIVAENQAIPVHRCLLIARSEYFRALLAFYDQQEPTRSGSTKELVVDESYLGMLRVLNFIYNDELRTMDKNAADPDDERTDQLLEDLIAADKYGLVRMKRLCEHHVKVTQSNCLDVLVVADLVHADHLKQVAMAFVQTNLHILSDSPGAHTSSSVLQRLAHEFPHLLTELYDRLHRHTQQQTLLRDWQRQVENDIRMQQEQQELEWQEKQAEAHFPWVPLILAFVFATLYLTVMNAQESDYPLVPGINLIVIGGLIAAAFLGKI